MAYAMGDDPMTFHDLIHLSDFAKTYGIPLALAAQAIAAGEALGVSPDLALGMTQDLERAELEVL